MATTAISKILSPGIPSGTVVTTTRALQPDLWAYSMAKGGGKNSAQVDKHHLTNLFLGLAAPTPGEARAAVQTLRQLRLTARVPVFLNARQDPENPHAQLVGQVQDLRGKSDVSLGETIEGFIAAGEDPAWREAWAQHRRGLEISLCVEPASAQITTYTSDGVHQDYYQMPGEDLPFSWNAKVREVRRSRRVTILTHDVITVASALWSDTLARRALMDNPSLLPEAVPNAEARTENGQAAIPTAAQPSRGYSPEGHSKAGS
ncbi:hypothetical protein [Teichococcus wenyumeiae]|nr:hypothetical protein [Pseudoroseomonas wenyumeiae]